LSSVTLEGVSKRYGSVTGLKAIDLTIQEGEFITLLGPSGCGKTTTLRLIAGFIDPSEGRILLGKDDVTKVAPQNRKIGMVFQDYALFPHLSIFQNVAFPLRERKVPKDQIYKRVHELLELVELPGVADRYPSELSGGQAQRIAVARAVSYLPRVLLMDEPLGALDLKLRETMQLEIRRIQQELGITTVFVTHDQTEAMSMSDRIVVMNNGQIEQIGSAREIYKAPRNTFVADFIGKINLIDVTVIEISGQEARLNMPGERSGIAPLTKNLALGVNCLGVRPENVRFRNEGEDEALQNSFTGQIRELAFSGNLTTYFVDVGLNKPILVEQGPGFGRSSKQVGQTVTVYWDAESALLLGSR
jgi:spermidine/putrescine ABC transporter ATP-binding subunit